MLNPPTSHAQRLQRQICSLWYSILISESLPILFVTFYFWNLSLSISENCKNTTHHTKWPCLLQLFSSFLHVWLYWHQVSCFACWQSPCADTSPKLEVSTPCPKTKRPREDAVQKGQMTFFNPHFPNQSVNCFGQDNRGCFLWSPPRKM